MSFFTFLFEYDGGTYISQVQAEDSEHAAASWAKTFSLHKKPDFVTLFEDDFHKKLCDSIEFDLPVEIEAVVNTWNVSTIYLDKPASINCVKTVEP